MFIDVRCQFCDKLLCRVSKDFLGIVQLKCQHQGCKRINNISLAVILKQMKPKSAILNFPSNVSAK